MDHYCTVRDMNHGIKPKDGPVLVTGASGGVGSIAAMILASMGYRVTASTGRPEEAAWQYCCILRHGSGDGFDGQCGSVYSARCHAERD